MTAWSSTRAVRWADVDANGHARSTAYSDMAADCRLEYLAEQGFGLARLAQLGIGPVLLEERLVYHRETRYGERLEVTVAITELKRHGARAVVEHELRKSVGAELAAEVRIHAGWLSLERRALTSPPRELADLLSAALSGA